MKLLKTLKAALGIFLIAGVALAMNIPMRTGPVDVADTRSVVNQLVNDINTLSPGLLFGLPALVATAAGTGEQILGTYTLPPSYLTANGQALRLKATFRYAANTNNRTPKLYFGASSITGTVNATSGGTAYLYCDVLRTGAATQSVACGGQDGVTNLATAFTAGADDLTTALVLKASCTDGTSSAGDCNLQTMTIESLR